MATVNELITSLGFEIKPEAIKKINDFQVSIDSLKNGLQELGKFSTMGMDLTDFVKGTLAYSNEIVNLSKTLDMSTKSIQEWQYAAEASGVSSQTVMRDIQHLRTNFRMTEKGVLNLANSFKKMSAGGAYFYGQMYGLSEDTVLMLRQGKDAIQALKAEAQDMGAVIPDEELKNAREFNKNIQALKTSFTKMAQTIVTQVVPHLMPLLEEFTKFIKEHPDAVINTIKTGLIALAAGETVSKLESLVGIIKDLGLGLVGLAGFAKILGGGAVISAIGTFTTAIAGLAGAFGGISLGLQALDNLINGTNNPTWLENFWDKIGFTEWAANKLGIEKGSWAQYKTGENLQKETGISTPQPNLSTNPVDTSSSRFLGKDITFSGTTVNIFSALQPSEIIKDVATNMGGTNQRGLGLNGIS